MNDLSNMPIVTPMNDSQWVPDGSGITPSPWEMVPSSMVTGQHPVRCTTNLATCSATSERQLTRQVGFPPPAAFFTTSNATSLPQRGGIFHYHFLFRIDL